MVPSSPWLLLQNGRSFFFDGVRWRSRKAPSCTINLQLGKQATKLTETEREGGEGVRGQHLSLSFGCGEPMKWLNQLEAVIMRLTNEAREQERGEKGGEGWGACGTTTLCSLVHVASTSISEQAGCATCVPPLGASRILCDEIYA